MNDFNVYVMVGIPGAGKSTWIKNNVSDLPIVSRDLIRVNIGMCGEGEKCVGSREAEQLVTKIENGMIEQYCMEGRSFVIDDTNTGKFRGGLIDRLKSHGAHIVFVRVNTPVELCKKRREGQIPGEVLDRLNNSIIEPKEGEYDELINYEGY